jgi:ADP-ribosylation factor GTPase-activating protein 1
MLLCSPYLSVYMSILYYATYITIIRSLGVHISFVRSIAMDSWTDQQLALMKMGGNEKCNSYLKKNGIDPRTPIKQKYESETAQLYKEVLKARVAGLPEPTQLPKKVPRKEYVSANSGMSSGSGGMSGGGGGMSGGMPGGAGGMPGGGAKAPASTDVNGSERLAGETDQKYIARQTRLRDEAKARMAAKFGGGGMMGGGGRMGGVGSDPSYNPNGGSSMGGMDMGSLYSGLGSVASSMKSSITSIADEQTVQGIKSTGSSFWGSLTSGVSSVAQSIVAPDGDDGLADLQRQIASQKPMQSKYSGFGSDVQTGSGSGGGGFNSGTTMNRGSSSGSFGSNAGSSVGLQEAPGLPGEDRNGIERLSGESDDQYVMRQTTLRDEAKARMAAKFGGGGMGSGMGSTASAPASGNSFSGSRPTQSAPSSGNAMFSKPAEKSPPKKAMQSGDFFSSFGT